ncbi:hypothetical protein FOZ60_003652 [Perkinsus olseni]|uniref:Rab-GAP TBC domain-containing protein n=1 Tax=Perkinsus olseni TaxID=32597 RepID=A0A7J6NX32_PEROL|nr:hypothetical protein FOZ60_003652 [Perkinsus olseni]
MPVEECQDLNSHDTSLPFLSPSCSPTSVATVSGSQRWFLQGPVASIIVTYLPEPSSWQCLTTVCKSWATRLITFRDTAAERARWPMTVQLRPRIWHALLLDEDIMTRDIEEDPLAYYDTCWRASAEDDSVASQVWRDVVRTEPCASCVGCFHHRLWRVLMATSERLKTVGYCQGMNYVVNILLKVSYRKVGMVRKRSDDSEDKSDEDQLYVEEAAHKWGESVECPHCPVDEAEVMTFRSAVSLLVRYQMVRMFELSDRFRLTLWTFDRLLEAALPRVHALLSAAFDGLGVPSSFYASSWFLTLFASDLRDEEDASERIFDIFLSKGWKAIHRIGLVLMDAAFANDDLGHVEACDANDLLMIKLKCLPGIVISELGRMLENAAQVDGGARLVLSRAPGFEVPLSGSPETTVSPKGCSSGNYRSRGRSQSMTSQTYTGWAIVASTLPEHQFKLDPDDDFDRNIFDGSAPKKSSGRWSFRKRISTRKAKKLLGKLSRSRSGRSPGGTYHTVRSEMLGEGDSVDGEVSPEHRRQSGGVVGAEVYGSPTHDFAFDTINHKQSGSCRKEKAQLEEESV